MASLSFLARRRDLPKNILNQYNYHRVIAPRWPYGAESLGASTKTISSYNIVNQNNHNMCSMLQSSPYSTCQNHLLTTIDSFKTLSSSQQQQRRSLFIQTSETPNPESLKFIPNGRLVLGHKSDDVDIDDTQMNEDGEGIELEDNTSDDNDNNNSNNNDTKGVYLTRKDHTLIARSPLAKLLFNLDLGIKSIYLGYDFITGKGFFQLCLLVLLMYYVMDDMCACECT